MNNYLEYSKQFLSFFIKLLIILITLFAFTKLLGPIPFSMKAINSGVSDVFSMTGEGKATIKPDIAVVALGVSLQAPTVKEAQDLLNEKINKVTGELKKLGIDEKDIKTENYNIYPEYNPVSISEPAIRPQSDIAITVVPSKSDQNIRAYSASTNISVKVRDTEKVNQIIDTGTQNGANQVGGISFDVDDRSAAENEARMKAVEDAKKKAEAAAKVAGFKLGKIINYYESLNPYGPYGAGYSGVASDLKEAIPTEIQPGSMEVVVSATINYEIK